MDPKHLTILFYGLVAIGVLLLFILLFKVIFKGEEIDKNHVTWLIVAFVCVVFPVVGNMTLEYGEFKLTLTKMSGEAQELAIIIENMTEENAQLQSKVEELNAQIIDYRTTLLSPDVSQNEKTEILDGVNAEFENIGRQSSEINRNLEIANTKNRILMDDLNRYKKN